MSETQGEPTESTVSDAERAAGQSSVAGSEDEYAQGETTDPEGADREAPAGEDYAGSGF